MLVENVHVNPILLEVIVIHVSMPIVMTMEGVLAKVPILLGINVINVLQVTP